MGSLEDVIQDIRYDMFLLETAKEAGKLQKGSKTSSILRVKTRLRSGDTLTINHESHGVRAEMKSLFDMPSDSSSTIYITTEPDFPNMVGIIGNNKNQEISKRVIVGSFITKRKSVEPSTAYIQDAVVSSVGTWVPTSKTHALVRVPPGSEDSMMMRAVKQISLSDVAPSCLHLWAKVFLPYIPHDAVNRSSAWQNATAKDNKYIIGYNEQLKCVLVRIDGKKGKSK